MNIYKYLLIVIVNSVIFKNFILLFFANKKEFFIKNKNSTYNIIAINKNPLASKNWRINKKMKLLLIKIQYNLEEIIFDIL